jgi:hypothetical protein
MMLNKNSLSEEHRNKLKIHSYRKKMFNSFDYATLDYEWAIVAEAYVVLVAFIRLETYFNLLKQLWKPSRN